MGRGCQIETGEGFLVDARRRARGHVWLAVVVADKARDRDRGSGLLDRAAELRQHDLIIVGQRSGEHQAGHSHQFASTGAGVGVGTACSADVKRRGAVAGDEAAQTHVSHVQRSGRSAVVVAWRDGDATDADPDQHAGEDDVVPVPSGIVDAESLIVASEEHRSLG